MHSANDPLKWGYKLLFVLLYVVFIVPMGYWYLPFTIPFFVACVALLFPLITSKKELLLECDAHLCTLWYKDVHDCVVSVTRL